MTTARSCWKRLNTDLEDGDECLPISKRICSLHIESQTQELNSQNNHVPVNPCHGFSDSTIPSPPLIASNGLDLWSVASQSVSSCRLDSNNEFSSSTKTLAQFIQENSVQGEMNQRIASTGPSTHYNHPLDDPNLAYQHKLNPIFHSGDPLLMPISSFDQQCTAQQNQHLSQQRRSLESHEVHIASHSTTDSSSVTHLQGMSEYNIEFHMQQLPTGIYDPELGMEENPYYYSVNQLLYEAHLYRVRRENSFSSSS